MQQDIVTLLIDQVETGASSTRIAAIKALGEGAPQTQEVINCLKKHVETGSADTRIAAISALGRLFRKS